MSGNYEIIEVTELTLDIAIDFLVPHEYKCVSLMRRLLDEKGSRLQKKDVAIFFIKKQSDSLQSQTIQGVFLITKGGLLLHHFVSFDFQALIKPVLHKKKIYCIAGTAEGSALFESALRKNVKTIFDYHLMAYSALNYLQNLKNSAKVSFILPEKISLHRCSLLDAKALYPLQKAYHIEEVLPAGEAFIEKTCKIILQNILSEQIVYALINRKNNRFIAKAGTNAQGLNWVQVGGVYTETKYRNQGFACYLVRYLAEKNPKSTVLFVKKDNLPAIAAYTKASFSLVGAYRICYI